MPDMYESPRVPRKRSKNFVEIVEVDESWAEDLLESVLKLDSPFIVQSTLNLALKDAGFGRYLRPSKLKDD